ncbi:pre-mRNA-processing factor 39, partial [Patella vulgata]|uniref:pre-mRNA-processing factor 39 n=1 Tax=Patella vulgata TaxID=6465 RepID=UPI00217FE471
SIRFDVAFQIFERGVKGIPLSIDLWIHYITFYTTEFGENEGAEEKIRKLYERAVEASGTDFKSDKLWDSYIAWETSKNNLKRVTQLYEKVLSIPTQLYSHHFEGFKNHIRKHHPKETLQLDEFLTLRQEVVISSKDEHEDDGGADELPPGEDEPPGVDIPPGLEDTNSVGDKDEAIKVQERVIELREVIYKQNENEVSKRWGYEEAIRRPYFHVKPLERSQLKNWREYLDFEISNGCHERVVVLFERCMIACGLYEDFWMKYAKYLEQHSTSGVRNVYKRVCQIHLPKKPYIHLAWAAFEERQQNYTAAREVLRGIEQNVKGLVMVAIRRISLERRQGNHTEVEQLFEEYIRTAATPTIRSFFSIKYARYLQKLKENADKARTILKEAISHDQKNEKLFMQLLDVEYQCHPIKIDKVMELFENAFKSDIPKTSKVKLSQRRMEFLEDFGNCVKVITEAYDEHQKLVKDMTSDSRKRSADSSEGSVEKKSKTEISSNGTTGDTLIKSHTSTTDPSSYDYHWDAYSNSAYSSYNPHYYNYSSYYQQQY